MTHMMGHTHLHLTTTVGGEKIDFWFTNDQVADEFAQLDKSSRSE